MTRDSASLVETHVTGGRTRLLVVRSATDDRRAWLDRAPVCPALGRHEIAHAGVAEASTPFRIVRARQSGTYFLACFGGEGRILVDGRWQRCRAGTACLLPPHILNAFHAVPGSVWEFCWVRYRPLPEQRPISANASPVLARFNAAPLRAAILGLHAECQDAATPAMIHHWVELVQGQVLRFAQPWAMDDRLWKLWEQVANSLAEPWTLDRLAREVNVSGEHLRRLCRRELGRSPMHQVTYLRIKNAADLLATTADKIETIALAVGYQNPFVFSNTFKKWIGWRPSEHRQQQGRGIVGKA